MQAFFWMTGSLASFCLMAIGARELAGAIGTFQILLVRSAIGLLAIGSLMMHLKKQSEFRTRRWRLHIGRNLLHFLGQYGWFVGIGMMPLAQVFALEFTTPLWTLLIAALVLREALSARKFVAILFGLLGVILMLNLGNARVSMPMLIVLAAALFYSSAYVSTKALSSSESPLTILFYMCLIQLPLGIMSKTQSGQRT